MAVIVSRVTGNGMQMRAIDTLALATTYLSLEGPCCTHQYISFHRLRAVYADALVPV